MQELEKGPGARPGPSACDDAEAGAPVPPDPQRSEGGSGGEGGRDGMEQFEQAVASRRRSARVAVLLICLGLALFAVSQFDLARLVRALF